jgi:hypothetical protein
LERLVAGYARHEVPGKVRWVVDEVRRLVAQGKKVVVWASFVANLHLLRRHLEDLSPLLVYGGIPAYAEDDDSSFESRERNIDAFKHDNERFVLLANPAACAESISLHNVCHDAIYLERTFNCAQFLQSLDRIHRVGLPPGTETVYQIPLAPCSIERVLDRRLKHRQPVLYKLLEDDMPILGAADDSPLLEQEDDLERIFAEVLEEIKGSGQEDTTESGRTTRTPRRAH